MPLPALAVFSGVLSKVARLRLPARSCCRCSRDARAHFQELLLLIALASILYGSAMAFTQTQRAARRSATRRSPSSASSRSGSSRSTPQGAQGALLQMVNHGLVVAPLFFIVALLAAARRRHRGHARHGRDRVPRAGARRAVPDRRRSRRSRCPGSANFVGEFLILLGTLRVEARDRDRRLAGVVLAAVYMLRLYIRSMHNRVGPMRRSRARCSLRDGLVLVPLVLAIIALRALPAVRAQARRAQPSSRIASPTAQRSDAASSAGRREDRDDRARRRRPKAPAHRLGGALAAARAARRRAASCCSSACCARAAVREHVVPVLDARRARRRDRAGDLAVGRAQADADRGRAARSTRSTLVADADLLRRRHRARCCSPGAQRRRARPAHGEFYALLLTRDRRAWSCSSRRRTSSTLFLGLELLSIPLYVLCATELRREHSLESGLKYLIIGSVGSATLLYGLALHLRRDRRDRLRGDRAGDRRGSVVGRRAAADRHRARASPASPSRPRSRRSTSGRPTSTRARRRRSPRSWRWRRRPPRSA